MAARELILVVVTLLVAACAEPPGESLAEARRLYEEGRPREAREILLDLAKDVPPDEAHRADLAELLVMVEEPKTAVEVLEAPGVDLSTSSLETLAYAHLKARNREAAGKIIQGLFDGGKPSATAHRLRGLWLGSRDSRALAALRKAHQMDPEDPLNWAFLGALLGQTGRQKEAESLLGQGCARFPESPELRVALAHLILPREDEQTFKKVVRLLRPVAKSRPLDKASRLNLALALRKTGKSTEAERVAEKLTEEWPDDAAHWSELGLARKDRGKIQEAVAALERAAELAPKSVEALLNLGNAHLERVEVEREREPAARAAFLVFERARTIAPRNPDVYVGLGRATLKANPADDPKAERTINFYKKALEIDPKHFQANLNIALIYYDLWNPDRKSRGSGYLKALEHFEKAAAVVPPEKWDRHAREAYEELRRR